jgi:hypothetical protein
MIHVKANTTNPWIETMKTYMTKIFGSDVLGTKTLALLSATWTPSTTSSTIRRYFVLCEEHRLAPLGATPVHMASYVVWLGQLNTIKASSLQTNLSAVNGFFKDHGLEAISLDDQIAKVVRRLAASKVVIKDTPIRVHMLSSIVV